MLRLSQGVPGVSFGDADRSSVQSLWHKAQQLRDDAKYLIMEMAFQQLQLQRMASGVRYFALLASWGLGEGLPLEPLVHILKFLLPSFASIACMQLQVSMESTRCHPLYIQWRLRREAHDLQDLNIDVEIQLQRCRYALDRLTVLAEMLAVRYNAPDGTLSALVLGSCATGLVEYSIEM